MLEREEKEKLFNEHVEALAKKKKEQFRQLLDETSTVSTSDDDLCCLHLYQKNDTLLSFNLVQLAFENVSGVTVSLTDICVVDHFDNNLEGSEKGDQGGPSLYKVLLQ